MSSIATILERIARTTGCTVLEPCGLPPVRAQDRLSQDLRDFYALCGGVRLFDGRLYPMRVVEPHSFARSNLEIVGDEFPDDITDSWYIVARGGSAQLISIDCHPDRIGRCYDSFWDRHGVAGSCPIVALSFTE
ncbi:MAG TPA: SMI1/KNR4 family protein [Nocardioides sp.]|nr:SMI1/KNR4 family protein [Nocardioides sp.]